MSCGASLCLSGYNKIASKCLKLDLELREFRQRNIRDGLDLFQKGPENQTLDHNNDFPYLAIFEP